MSRTREASKPTSQHRLVNGSISHADHHGNLVYFRRFEDLTVEKQEGTCRQESSALVAIKERMIFHDPETQGSSKVEKRRGVAISKQVLRPIYGTIE